MRNPALKWMSMRAMILIRKDANALRDLAVDRKTFKTWSVNYCVEGNWRIEDFEDGGS